MSSSAVIWVTGLLVGIKGFDMGGHALGLDARCNTTFIVEALPAANRAWAGILKRAAA